MKERIDERVRDWNVVVQRTIETESSILLLGTRHERPVVLKIIRNRGDEWRCGAVLDAFEGKGSVRVYDYVDGAVLMERLSPGRALADLSLAGRDDEATDILADVMQQMSDPRESPAFVPTVQNWGSGFDRYLASGDEQIPRALVEQGQQLYLALAESQRSPRLLHGDLQHYNVLLDAERGWLAIDPKGVVGEIEYEIGASLRNPHAPTLFASAATIRNRLRIFEACLKLDADRALRWSFAQAVLSAIWSIEDGAPAGAAHSALLLADAIRPLLG